MQVFAMWGRHRNRLPHVTVWKLPRDSAPRGQGADSRPRYKSVASGEVTVPRTLAVWPLPRCSLTAGPAPSHAAPSALSGVLCLAELALGLLPSWNV